MTRDRPPRRCLPRHALSTIRPRACQPSETVDDRPDRHPLGGAVPARAGGDARRGQLPRARDARDRPRSSVPRARRGRGSDRRRRQPLRRLRLLVGSADPRARPPGRAAAIAQAAARRHELRRAHRRRGRARGRGRAADGGRGDAAHDLLRHRGFDDRDPPRPRGHRPRAGAQVRGRLPRPRRRPAGPGGLRVWRPSRCRPAPACPPARPRRRWSSPGTTPRRCAARPRQHELAAILAEPLPANMGLVPPRAGLSRAAARARQRDRRAARARRGHLGLSRRPRRRPGADGRHRRSDDHGQGARRRPARRRRSAAGPS